MNAPIIFIYMIYTKNVLWWRTTFFLIHGYLCCVCVLCVCVARQLPMESPWNPGEIDWVFCTSIVDGDGKVTIQLNIRLFLYRLLMIIDHLRSYTFNCVFLQSIYSIQDGPRIPRCSAESRSRLPFPFRLQLPAPKGWWWIITLQKMLDFPQQKWAPEPETEPSRRGIPDAQSSIGFLCHVPKVEVKKDQPLEPGQGWWYRCLNYFTVPVVLQVAKLMKSFHAAGGAPGR